MLALADRHESIASRVLDDMVGPNTLAHADCRSDNLLFDDDGIIILDFQLAAICHGMADVAYFISQSVHDDVAAAHADELIDTYLARLAEHGISLDRDGAMRPYRAATVFFLAIPVSLLAGTELRSAASGWRGRCCGAPQPRSCAPGHTSTTPDPAAPRPGRGATRGADRASSGAACRWRVLAADAPIWWSPRRDRVPVTSASARRKNQASACCTSVRVLSC